jgi:hypothetical protein
MTIYEKHIIFSGGGNWHHDHNHGTEKAGGIDWIGYQNEYFCSSLYATGRSTIVATFRNSQVEGENSFRSQ